MNRKHKTVGRYQGVGGASMPGGAIFEPQGVRTPGVDIRYGVVIAPSTDAVVRLKSHKVQINVRCDVVEAEYKAGRLSWDAYNAARGLQAVLESAAGRRSASHSLEAKDHGNAATAHEWAIIMGLEAAQESAGHLDFVRRHLGRDDFKLVSALLLWPGSKIADYALSLGYVSRRGRGRVGERFRRACEDLVDIYKHPRAPRS